MKNKIVILGITVVVVVILLTGYFRAKWKYNWQLEGCNTSQVNIDAGILHYGVIPYFKMHGEYPLDILYAQDNFDYEDSTSVFVNNGLWMDDPFTKSENQVVYYPIYNRITKLRESFIMLSAGTDGK